MRHGMDDKQVIGWATTGEDREVLDWLQAHLGVQSRSEVLRIAVRDAARSRGWTRPANQAATTAQSG